MKRLLLLLSVLFMLSCTYNEGLERTWERAGANRTELEKVLRHYEGDGRKYRAALFLLERMADCYSYVDTRIDSMKQLKYLSSLPNRGAWTDSVKRVWGHVSFQESRKVYDAQVMTADYLIAHIDHTFRVWDSRPWVQHYSFEEFCRNVLPYRLADEPLETWRERYYQQYAARVDSIYSGSDIIRKIQAVEAIIREDGTGWSELFPSLPHLGATFLLEHPVGVCRDLCDFSTYLLRALGIPAVTDYYIASPHTSGAHSWNAVRDTTGQIVSFWLPESKVGRGLGDGRPKGKVFRREYGGKVRDVTSEYFGTNEATVKMASDVKGQEPILCVFTCGNYIPVGKGKVQDEVAVFHNLEPGIRFFPMYKGRYGRLEFAGYPFSIDSLGRTESYVPDLTNRHRAVLRRKYAYHYHLKERVRRMSDSYVVGSEYADFRTSSPLFSFPSTLKTNRQVMVAGSDVPVRYVRWYMVPSQYSAEVAEVAFYGQGADEELPFRVLDLPEAAYNHGEECMTDGDVLTYYEAKEPGNQVMTFDLGKHVRLSRMLFVPHNDGNYIEPDDEYELFYHDGAEGWKSLGRQTATADSLVYDNVPDHAVLWLHDLTKGREEQQFILDEYGEQVFH